MGLLNDWDLSSLLEDGVAPPPVTQCRTGTTPFMAAELLEMCDNPPTHRYHHDLESFLYVLLWAMVHYNMGSEELNILPDPKKPRRLPTHKLLRPLEGDDYGANAAWKSNFKISKVSRRTLFAAVQPAFQPLVDTWLKPLLKLFTRAALDDTEDSSDPDPDSDTLGGILTFDNFMKAIGAVPREIPAEFKKDG